MGFFGSSNTAPAEGQTPAEAPAQAPKTTPEGYTPIPQPKESLFLGNIPEIDGANLNASLVRLTKLYGPILQLRLNSMMTVVSNVEMCHAICDETKFEKHIGHALTQVRNFAGDGLFTSKGNEHNWGLAHRILVPAFGPVAIRKMQPMMLDLITQMLLFWEHHAGEPFEASDQYTRLTFDTIGLCAFHYRFNSFHTDHVHPFINIMVQLLSMSQARAGRPGIVNSLMFGADAQYWADIDELWRQCDEIVAERRRNPDPDAKDLLNNMILDKDPKTGEKLPDENIRFQMVTFLIAGHETTSGLLTFVTYYLLKNPDVYAKAREEADRVIAEAGGNLNEINPSHLKYIDAVLKETLRLQPSAPAFLVAPTKEEGAVLPGGYHVPYGQSTVVVLQGVHTDPKAWGDDAEEFNPERWLDGRTIAPDSWKPFGHGTRACIGRGFATQEALLALALIVHRFDLEMADPSYDLHIKQTLTIKPKDFKIIARPRLSRSQNLLAELIAGGRTGVPQTREEKVEAQAIAAQTATGAGTKMYIYFGSNSGSCEGLAYEVASEAGAKGYAVTIGDLDSQVGNGILPTDGPVIIITASYEGKPTDNARNFVQALTDMKEGESKGVKYFVMGVGHHDWTKTFHKIPKFIDSRLEALGAERLLPMSTADAGGDIVGDFEEFKNKLWDYFGGKETPSTASAPPPPSQPSASAVENQPKASVKVISPTANPAGSSVSPGMDTVGTVVSQKILVEATKDCPQTNYATIQLPEGMTYRAGDYLAVLPKNPDPTVERAVKFFGLEADDQVVLSIPNSFLPNNTPVRLGDLLSSYVELGQPVSKRVLPRLAEFATEGSSKEHLKALEEDYTNLVTSKRMSLLDILETVPACKPSLEFFLSNLPKMKIRQYSISSTPLVNPEQVTITYTVHTAPDKTGKGSYLGVASNYLAFLEAGDKFNCTIKSSSEFHLPIDPSTPVVMFAAGSGVAPFRGFVEERALQRAAGRKVGPSVLFFGCRTEYDMLHADELGKWVSSGDLDFRPTFSRSDATELANAAFGGKTTLVADAKYAQDRVWAERADMASLFEQGAQFYTCGSGARLGKGLRDTLVKIIGEELKKKGSTLDAEAQYDKLAKDRYRTDVFL